MKAKCTRCQRQLKGEGFAQGCSPYHLECWIEEQRDRWGMTTDPKKRKRIEERIAKLKKEGNE